ncbi:hypothetical protein TRAPUB_1400 [Trametes pubescens]|uniref:Uncharacterized protein n=1 Tax=Trametes pubescens TaxID=154538 RepID=A0A1M2VJG3_TRAPU|nr:hypothetical protein TRAPUB_1400 [Trametes pubescens]
MSLSATPAAPPGMTPEDLPIVPGSVVLTTEVNPNPVIEAPVPQISRALVQKRHNYRKKALFDARLAVVLDRGLERHSVLFDRLTARDMSGDETETYGGQRTLPATYQIVETRWQSKEFKTFMRTLDAMHRNDWETAQFGQRANARLGSPPRTRILRADDSAEDGYAPRGLWRNCYDQDWLHDLAPPFALDLGIIDTDYNFDLKPGFDRHGHVAERGWADKEETYAEVDA